MPARIPTSLIPNDVKKPIRKRALGFAVVVTGVFAIPLGLAIPGLISQKDSKPLNQVELQWLSQLSNYFCKVKHGLATEQQGRAALVRYVKASNTPRTVVNNKLIAETARASAERLSSKCDSVADSASTLRLYKLIRAKTGLK